MVIYAFEKLRIIFSVIIFHFKEPVSNINSPSPHHLPLTCVVYSHLLFLFAVSFQGFGVCFQSLIHPETHSTSNPFLLLFSFYSGFGNSLLLYSASPSCGWRNSRSRGWEAPLGPRRWQEVERDVDLSPQGSSRTLGVRSSVCPLGASQQARRAALKAHQPWEGGLCGGTAHAGGFGCIAMTRE